MAKNVRLIFILLQRFHIGGVSLHANQRHTLISQFEHNSSRLILLSLLHSLQALHVCLFGLFLFHLLNLEESLFVKSGGSISEEVIFEYLTHLLQFDAREGMDLIS